MAILLRRSRRADWLRHCVGLSVLSLALVAGSASATTITLSRFPPNPGLLPGGGWKFTPGTNFADPPPARAWVNGVYGGVPKTVATDVVSVAGRAGALSITASQSIGFADGAAAVARCLLGGGVVCGAASAAAAAYAAYRIYSTPSGLASDPGMAPQTVNTAGKCVSTSPTICDTSDAGLAVKHMGISLCINGVAGKTNCTMTGVTTVTGSAISYGYTYTESGTLQTRTTTFGWSNGTITSQSCLASIDFSNPAYSVPAGSPVGVDGKCPTARYNHVPISAQDAATKAGQYPPVFPNATWRDAVKDSIDSGGQSAPSDITTSGPASQTGTPTQTVTTQGTTTTTTTNTPTYNYNYNGDTITYNTTNVTNTTINNNGTITTTTTTTTGGSAAPQDPTDPCTANPDRIGCKTAGTVAPQPDLYTKKDKTFDDVLADFKTQINATPLGTATNGFFNVGSGGTCPTWSAHIPFINADVTLDQFCSDFASTAFSFLKAALLVVSSLVAFRVAVL